MLYDKLLGSTHPGARILQVVSLPKALYSLRIDDELLNGTWTKVELAAGIDLQMEDTPAHKSGVALYYACSDSELDQTDRNSCWARFGLLGLQHLGRSQRNLTPRGR